MLKEEGSRLDLELVKGLCLIDISRGSVHSLPIQIANLPSYNASSEYSPSRAGTATALELDLLRVSLWDNETHE